MSSSDGVGLAEVLPESLHGSEASGGADTAGPHTMLGNAAVDAC